jgi:hypothetical protein
VGALSVLLAEATAGIRDEHKHMYPYDTSSVMTVVHGSMERTYGPVACFCYYWLREDANEQCSAEWYQRQAANLIRAHHETRNQSTSREVWNQSGSSVSCSTYHDE